MIVVATLTFLAFALGPIVEQFPINARRCF